MAGTSRVWREVLRDRLAKYAVTRIEYLRVRDRIAEGFELIERPNDLFCLRIEFDQKRLPGASVAVTDNVMPVGQNFERGHPRQNDPRQIRLVDLPDDLSLRCDFEHAVTVASGNQRIALGSRTAEKHLFPNASGPCPGLGCFPNSGTEYSQITLPV